MLEVEILEGTERRVRFILRGVATPIANALRRIMIAEVPSMAIDDVIIIENSSSMLDEILAHRLGLVPLKTDLDNFFLPEDCTCKSELGCSKCRVTLTLEAEARDAVQTVYSGSLLSEDPNVVPVSDEIPIVKLAPDQKVRLEAYAKLGRGKDHAKWQPVSACAYKYMPEIQVNLKGCDACGKCIDICSKRVLRVEEGKLIVANPLECTLCRDCEDVCPQNPSAIKIGWSREAFIFYVESTGVLPVGRIIVEASNILKKKCDEFISQASSLEESIAE